MPVIVSNRVTVGRTFEQLTVSNSVQILTPSKYMDSTMSGGAIRAFLTCENDAIRYVYSPGVTPTSTVGHKLPDGGILVLEGQQQMANFKCIRVTTDSVVTVTYEYD